MFPSSVTARKHFKDKLPVNWYNKTGLWCLGFARVDVLSGFHVGREGGREGGGVVNAYPRRVKSFIVAASSQLIAGNLLSFLFNAPH